MSNIKELPKDVIEKIKELVDQNQNPSSISETIRKEFQKSYAYKTIVSKIQKHLYKSWNTDKKTHEPIIASSTFKKQNSPIPGQMSLLNSESNPSKIRPKVTQTPSGSERD